MTVEASLGATVIRTASPWTAPARLGHPLGHRPRRTFPGEPEPRHRDRPDADRGQPPGCVRHRRGQRRTHLRDGQGLEEHRQGRQRRQLALLRRRRRAVADRQRPRRGPVLHRPSSTRILRFLSGAPAGEYGGGDRRGRQRGKRHAPPSTRAATQRGRLRLRPDRCLRRHLGADRAAGGRRRHAGHDRPLGLAPGTTYHVRVRATNEEASIAGGDTTFATPALPPPPVKTTTLTRAPRSAGPSSARGRRCARSRSPASPAARRPRSPARARAARSRARPTRTSRRARSR